MATESFQAIVSAIVFGYHTETRRTAIHSIKLNKFWERFHLELNMT